MGAFGTAFNALSLIYIAIAVVTLFRVARAGRALWLGELSAGGHRLVSAAAFYLFTPFAVALHELGHAVVIWLFGGRVVDYHFLFYWGYVVPDRSFGPYGDLWVALAGNLVTVALGAAAARLVLRHPFTAAINLFFERIAEIQISLALIFYPVMCLVGFGGDWLAIYRRDTLPVSAPLFALHLLVVGLLFRARKGQVGATLRLRASPLWDEIRQATVARARDPASPLPLLRLAWAHLQGGLSAKAAALSREALGLSPDLPAARAMLGQALAGSDAAGARRELEAALGHGDLVPVLVASSHLALARLCLAAGDAAAALPHALLAAEAFPRDREAIELLETAAGVTGTEDRARPVLERAASAGNVAARQALEDRERALRRAAS